MWVFKNDTSGNSPGLIQPCSDHLCDQKKTGSYSLLPFYPNKFKRNKFLEHDSALRQTSLNIEKFVFNELNLPYKAAVCF